MKNIVPYFYSPYIPLQILKKPNKHDKKVRKEIGNIYARLIRKLIPNEIKEKQLRIRYQRRINDIYTFYLSIRGKGDKKWHSGYINCDIHNFEFHGNNVIISKRTMAREKDTGKWFLTCERIDRTFDMAEPDFVKKVRELFGEPHVE